MQCNVYDTNTVSTVVVKSLEKPCPKWFLRLLIFHHGTKFGTKMLIDAQIMAPKRNSKWHWSEIRNHLGQGVSKLLAMCIFSRTLEISHNG